MSKTCIGFVTFGGLDFTKLVVERLKETVKSDYKLVVVSGKPDDSETLEYLVENDITCIAHAVNKGFPASLNDIYDYAWKYNSFDNLIILGNDVLPYPYAVDSLIKVADTTDYEWVCSREYSVKDLLLEFPETQKDFQGSNCIFTDFTKKPWEAMRNYTNEISIGEMGLSDVHNLCLYKKSVFEKIGYIDVNFYPCLIPETKVLTSNLTWKQLKDVKVGEELVGVDEYPDSDTKTKTSRAYRKSKVEAKRYLKTHCIKLTLENGKTVTCSDNHRWLARIPKNTKGEQGYSWKTTSSLNVGDGIYAPLNVWEDSTSFDEGWLSGIFDGEGCLHYGPKMRGISFYQNKGKVLNRAKNILSSMGIPYKAYNKNGIRAEGIEINNRKYLMETLGRLKPTRLLKTEVWDGLKIRGKLGDPTLRITNIEDVGIQYVIDIQTSSKTFLAEGMITHNCYFEDNDYCNRAIIVGIKSCTVMNSKYFHFWSRTIHQGTGGSTSNQFQRNMGFYSVKWGGPPSKETLKIPFNGKDYELFYNFYLKPEINIQSRDQEDLITGYWRNL
jgi:GT2 family glycosyltransferase